MRSSLKILALLVVFTQLSATAMFAASLIFTNLITDLSEKGINVKVNTTQSINYGYKGTITYNLSPQTIPVSPNTSQYTGLIYITLTAQVSGITISTDPNSKSSIKAIITDNNGKQIPGASVSGSFVPSLKY